MARRVRSFRPNARGTKFLIFPQSPSLGLPPESVRLNVRPGTIEAGPRDTSIYVIDARRKFSYRRDDTLEFRHRAPYPPRAPRFPPARPRDGHFDHLVPGSRSFDAANTFAVARLVLEIWEHHLGRRISWHFRKDFGRRLEIIPHVSSNNAWSGDGYLEFGYPGFPDPMGREVPFCLNFEVVAHEMGHLILKSVIGTMPDDEKSLMHRAHEEAAADLVAVLAALQLDSVLTFALERTRGRLYSVNAISRIGEWGPSSFERLRAMFNDSTMSAVRQTRRLDKYLLARPFAGGAFDAFVEIFETHLVEAGAIPPSLGRASRHARRHPTRSLRRGFAAEYARHAPAFRRALAVTRDEFARLLARAWDATPREHVTFGRVVANLLAADRELFGARGRHQTIIRQAFQAREIVPEA